MITVMRPEGVLKNGASPSAAVSSTQLAVVPRRSRGGGVLGYKTYNLLGISSYDMAEELEECVVQTTSAIVSVLNSLLGYPSLLLI